MYDGQYDTLRLSISVHHHQAQDQTAITNTTAGYDSERYDYHHATYKGYAYSSDRLTGVAIHTEHVCWPRPTLGHLPQEMPAWCVAALSTIDLFVPPVVVLSSGT